MFVAYLVYGGYLFLTSGGEEAKITKGKKVIFTSILGVVVISLAYSLTKFVFTSLDQAQTGEEGLEFSTSPAPLPEPGTGNGGSMPWSVN